jgi:hypothetical protein
VVAMDQKDCRRNQRDSDGGMMGEQRNCRSFHYCR